MASGAWMPVGQRIATRSGREAAGLGSGRSAVRSPGSFARMRWGPTDPRRLGRPERDGRGCVCSLLWAIQHPHPTSVRLTSRDLNADPIAVTATRGGEG